MSLTTRPLSPRRAAAVVLVSLSLTGISACSVSIGGGSTDQDAAATASQEAPSTEQAAPASQSATPANSSQIPSAQASAPSTQEQTAPAASAGAGATGAGAQPAAGERPGAQATITDSKWLEGLEDVDRTVSASPSMILDKANEDVRIEGDVDALSVSASTVEVFADYVSVLTISGSNVTVYVKDVDRVVIKGSGVDVVWAGNTPKVEDFGTNTETRSQSTKSSRG